MTEFARETAHWIDSNRGIQIEIGSLISAASEWTEDEMELDDFVCELVDAGHVTLRIG